MLPALSPRARIPAARCLAAWPARRGCGIHGWLCQPPPPDVRARAAELCEWAALRKLQLGTEKGAFGPRDGSKRDAFCIDVPTASSSPAQLIPAPALELQRPGWHWPQHPKAAAAASPPGLGEEPSQLPGRAGRPLPAYGGSRCWAAPGKAPGTRRVRHGQRAHASLLTPRRPRGPRPCLPPRRPGSHRTLLLSWPEDLLAAGVKFPAGTYSPIGGGGSQVLARVSHPALLAHAFGLPLLLPWAPQKTMRDQSYIANK